MPASPRHAPKAVRDGYDPAPFFFRDGTPGAPLVAWTPDVEQLARLLDRLLEGFPDRVEVTLGVRSDQGVDGRIRYAGECTRATLGRAVRDHADCLLQDGDSELAIRRPDGAERLVLDDCGVVTVHSDRPDVERACREAGFEPKREDLIGRAGCWRYSASGEARQTTIAALGLALAGGAPDVPERRPGRRRARFATVLWGTVGGVLLGLATNDVVRGVQGAGVGLLAIVSLAAGTMLIHAAVRIELGERRR